MEFGTTQLLPLFSNSLCRHYNIRTIERKNIVQLNLFLWFAALAKPRLQQVGDATLHGEKRR